MIRRTTLIALAALPALMHSLGAQSLETRVRAVGDGSAQFRFAARPGVCGDGHSYIAAGRTTFMGSSINFGRNNDWRAGCVPGPVRVVLSVHDGAVDNLRAYVGPDARGADAVTDLGTVSDRDASAYLLGLAARGQGRVGERSILPAVLADSSTPWPALFAIARDSSARPRPTRDAAFFWLSRAASAAVNKTDIFADTNDEDDESDVANSAVFALSQLRHKEGIDPLIEVARTNKNPRVRSHALFWLGQSREAKALALFQDLITR
ncbi:MAG: HEAT repeat domain-containing protein [Gemmatimonadota bacterium]|nr:HEAT repeat domain-containing protein [Gemmatimonadota bacterium]